MTLWQSLKETFKTYYILWVGAVMVAAVTSVLWLVIPLFGISYVFLSYELHPFVHAILVYSLIATLLSLYFIPFHLQWAKNWGKTTFAFIKIQLLFIFVATVCIASIIYLSNQSQQTNLKKEVYLFNEDFNCSAMVFYDIEGAPPLSFVDGTITYDFRESTILATSSPQDLGWEGKRSTGWHTVDIFIGDRLLPGDAMNMSLGAFSQNDGAEHYMQKITASESNACMANMRDPHELYDQIAD